jgi:hypothetical protein
MSTEILQAVIIAAGNFGGILIGYHLLERKIDRKILKYWLKVRGSPEGKDLFALLKDSNTVLKSPETQNLLKDLDAGVNEVREFLKKLREKAESGTEESEEEQKPLLPSLEG